MSSPHCSRASEAPIELASSTAAWTHHDIYIMTRNFNLLGMWSMGGDALLYVPAYVILSKY